MSEYTYADVIRATGRTLVKVVPRGNGRWSYEPCGYTADRPFTGNVTLPSKAAAVRHALRYGYLVKRDRGGLIPWGMRPST